MLTGFYFCLQQIVCDVILWLTTVSYWNVDAEAAGDSLFVRIASTVYCTM